jgi:hypothetical protein
MAVLRFEFGWIEAWFFSCESDFESAHEISGEAHRMIAAGTPLSLADDDRGRRLLRP